MCAQQHPEMVSRRAALAGIGVGGLGLALSTHGIRAIAQETSGTLAGHPIVGV